MQSFSSFTFLDPKAQICLQTELHQAARDPVLALLLGRASPDLPARFSRYHECLVRLPRKLRRRLQRQWNRSLAGLALLLALGQAPALAANFDIPCPGGAGDNAALIQAINDANDEGTNPGPDSITLVAGCTHTLVATDNNTYGASGLPVITSAVTIEGHGSTIRRDPADTDRFRIFAISNTGNLTLREATVSGGFIPEDMPGLNDGGGIANYGGVLNLENSAVSGNSADDDGGGVYNSEGTLSLTNSTVSGNSASGNGGGVYNSEGTLTLTNSTVSGNRANRGGGVYNGRGPLTITDSTVSGNSSSFEGGGVYNLFGSATLIHCTVSGNSAGAEGGGVYSRDRTLNLTDSTVSGNSASNEGGGVFHSSGTATITNSTISGNSAGTEGGGIYSNTDVTSQITTLSNSTVSGNSASRSGGGVFNQNGRTVIEHSTITGNTAPNDQGGGVASISDNYTSTEVRATIVAANSNTDVDSVSDSVTSFISNGDNLIGDGNAVGAFNQSSDHTGVIDPGLGPLAGNGGPTQTHALLAGSPAIDAVTGTCPPPATDQRGIERPQPTGSNCDIGSFELEPTPVPRFIYGVQDTSFSKSQFFSVDEAILTVTPLGGLQNGRDIEGLDIHPTAQVLYGTAGADNRFGQKGWLFTVDKDTGALTAVGATGFKSVEALSFRPTDATLWGWAENKGLATINPTTGAATRVLKSTKDMEGLAWDNEGALLYAASGNKLFVYDPATGKLTQIASNLPRLTEALEMRPDGLLALGVHGSTDIQAYDPITKQLVPGEAIPTGFNDVEGIAWPEETPPP